MSGKPYVIDEMISAKAIAARVEALAREISDYYRGTDKLVVVGLLRGSFIRSFWRFKYLPLNRIAYWFHALKWVQTVASTMVVSWLAVIEPAIAVVA